MTEQSSVRDFPVLLHGSEELHVSQEAVATTAAAADEPLVPLADVDCALDTTTDTTWRRPYADNDVVEVADVEEVERLEQDAAIITLRELRSFNHGVRLCFHAPELTFYAAIYMDDLLWRAVKSTEFDLAEKAFVEFVAQANQRARAEVRRIQLEARNAHLKQRIAESEARAERLRVNLQRNAAQKQRAMARDNALRNDIKQLEATRVHGQLHAERTTRRIGQLYSTCVAGLPRSRGLGFSYRKR